MWGPKNLEVTQPHHVQQTIISVILRQQGAFTKEQICEGVEKNLENSVFGKDGGKRQEVNVERMINDTLDMLWEHNCIKYDIDKKEYKLNMGFPPVSGR